MIILSHQKFYLKPLRLKFKIYNHKNTSKTSLRKVIKTTLSDEITSVLLELGSKVLEYFVKKLYATSATASLARERASLFEQSTDNDLRNIPMSRHGLIIQHTKRSCLQAGYLWRECFENVVLLDPSSWG